MNKEYKRIIKELTDERTKAWADFGATKNLTDSAYYDGKHTAFDIAIGIVKRCANEKQSGKSM